MNNKHIVRHVPHPSRQLTLFPLPPLSPEARLRLKLERHAAEAEEAMTHATAKLREAYRRVVELRHPTLF